MFTSPTLATGMTWSPPLPRCVLGTASLGLAIQRFQLPDHPLDDAEPALPEFRIAGVEAEWCQQFRMMLGAAGGEHRQIALGEAFAGALVNGVERVHQAVAESIGVNVERRMDEVRNVAPERLVTRAQVDCGAEALLLHLDPDVAE